MTKPNKMACEPSEDSDQPGRCPGWSESSLGAHSLCWFCHVAAHMVHGPLSHILAVCSYLYRNGPKFLDRQVWANSVDPDQTAPNQQSDWGLHCLPFHLHRPRSDWRNRFGSALFAILPASFGLIHNKYNHIVLDLRLNEPCHEKTCLGGLWPG